MTTKLDSDAADLLKRMHQIGLPAIGDVTAVEMRALRAARKPAAVMLPPMASVENLVISMAGGSDIPARLYRPVEQSGPLLVFFHGGGWTFGGIASSDLPARLLAEATACPLLSVEYRLAPEDPYPAATEDALAASLWAMDTGVAMAGSRAGIILAGESAGANLSAVTAQTLSRQSLAPLAQVLFCPLVSADVTADVPPGFETPFLTLKDIDWFLDQYAPDRANRLDAGISPARSPDLSGLPPTFIATAGCDLLQFQGEAYAQQLRQAGVAMEWRRYPGAFHGFVELACMTEAAGNLRRDLRNYIDRLKPGNAAK